MNLRDRERSIREDLDGGKGRETHCNLKTPATKEMAAEDIFFSFPSIIIQ